MCPDMNGYDRLPTRRDRRPTREPWDSFLKTTVAITVALSAALLLRAQDTNLPDVITVEQRIEAATRALGYFERTHSYNDFGTIIATLSEVNSPTPSGAPLNIVDWRIREAQIKDAFSTWFLIFRALDDAGIGNYNSLDTANLCYSYDALFPNPIETAIKAQQFEENKIRCERNEYQLLLSHMDIDAQAGLHKFLSGLTVDHDLIGSHFAYALGKSDLSGARSAQMWSIFATRDDTNWKPATSSRSGRELEPAYSSMDENTAPKEVDGQLIRWLHARNPRLVAWAA